MFHFIKSKHPAANFGKRCRAVRQCEAIGRNGEQFVRVDRGRASGLAPKFDPPLQPRAETASPM